jgi:hypothetical protein
VARVPSISRPFQQHYAFGRQGLFATDGAEPFAGLCLKTDLAGFKLQDLGNSLTDLHLERAKFWAFGKHDAVEIYDLVTSVGDLLVGQAEHLGRVATTVGGLGIGEQFADVPDGRRTQQRIGDGVQQHIGVAVAEQVAIMGQVDPAQP